MEGQVSTGRIRIILVDDHAIVRQGLASLLLDVEDVEVVGQADDGKAALTVVDRLAPDVVLMDIVMTEMDGADATAAIRAKRPGARILALSGSDVRSRILAALRAGALGYVSKTAPKDELVAAIRNVYHGRPVIPAGMAARLLEDYSPMPTPEPLTRREKEILKLVAKGLSNQEVAATAGISEATIRTHVGNIFGKLGVNNRVEATLCALRDGLTNLDECLSVTDPA